MTHPRRARARGYILLEALVAAALLGVALTSVMHTIGVGEAGLSQSWRRAQANAALWDGIARYTSVNANSLSVSDPETDKDVEGTVPGRVKRTIKIVAAPATICLDCFRVNVFVKYEDQNSLMKTIQASALVLP